MAKQQKKLWGGRFSKATDKRLEAFTDSTRYENRLVPYDIEGSLAHAAMLVKIGLISKTEGGKLASGLKKVLADWQKGSFKLDPAFEDVHGNVEVRLAKHVGALAGKLHSGRSRNDQIALDERLYLRDEVIRLTQATREAARAFVELAGKAPTAPMPGYTHLQRAQPIVFGHWCLAYVEMLSRDITRFGQVFENLDECPLGAGALAGSALPLDREWVAKRLGFGKVSANSLDSVSNRDYLLDLAHAMAVLMAHLSRLGEDCTLYCSQEFGFFQLDDSFATGSSLMPQKKNPDVAELLRGRAARAFGLVTQLQVLVKGQPLAYNRDMQEDKENLFETLDLVRQCLEIVPALLDAITPNIDRMRRACVEGFLDATDAADYLVKKGQAFRQAHEAVGQAVQLAQSKGKTLTELSLAEWRSCHPAFGPDITQAIALDRILASRKTLGGTAPELVIAALEKAREKY